MSDLRLFISARRMGKTTQFWKDIVKRMPPGCGSSALIPNEILQKLLTGAAVQEQKLKDAITVLEATQESVCILECNNSRHTLNCRSLSASIELIGGSDL